MRLSSSSCVGLLVAALVTSTTASYLPAYIEGVPKTAKVESLRDADYRGRPVYHVIFTVSTNGSQVVGSINRQYGEFVLLNQRLEEEVPIRDWSWTLPTEGAVSVGSLDKMLQDIMKNEKARDTSVFEDFLGINWNAQGVEWFKDLEAFMHMITVARFPEFAPEVPVIDKEEDVLLPETPFEKYVYLKAFREGFSDIDGYTEFLRNYTRQTPTFSGRDGDVDVRPPAAPAALELPYHYTRAYVHFLPDGYVNGQTVRLSYCGYSKFNFLKEDMLREWIGKLHGERKPKRILDMGTGNCFSAIVYAEMFPEAEVIGIDLAAPYIRFCRKWQSARGLTNLAFYQDNAENTSFVSDSFDIIHYAYVLHEMPRRNAELVLKEILRLLKPGGVMSGFEVPYLSDPMMRAMLVLTQTWGYAWDSDGPKGPEPFTKEYQEKTVLPDMIKELGFVNNRVIDYSVFDAFFLSHKPTAGQLEKGIGTGDRAFRRLTAWDVLRNGLRGR